MTKSQNAKDEQQKDLCITSEQLTEQWKKGELPSGWYWVEGCRAEGIYAYTSEYLNNIYRLRNGERIIEQVPSYEEWEKLNNACHELEKETACLTVDNVNLKKWCEEFNALEVAKENAKLKELLNKWLPEFDCYHDSLTSQFCREARELLGES